jgi:hypothetical protein
MDLAMHPGAVTVWKDDVSAAVQAAISNLMLLWRYRWLYQSINYATH